MPVAAPGALAAFGVFLCHDTDFWDDFDPGPVLPVATALASGLAASSGLLSYHHRRRASYSTFGEIFPACVFFVSLVNFSWMAPALLFAGILRAAPVAARRKNRTRILDARGGELRVLSPAAIDGFRAAGVRPKGCRGVPTSSRRGARTMINGRGGRNGHRSSPLLTLRWATCDTATRGFSGGLVWKIGYKETGS